MWLIVDYHPTALFSLRPAQATTGGSKTLLTPTPFALKMALLDAGIRTKGRDWGRGAFPQLRDMAVAVKLPKHLSVVSMFTKIRRPLEIKEKKTEKEKIAKAKGEKKWPWDSSISFREFVQYGGALQFAFEQPNDISLLELLAQLHYLGKRGCFVQFLSWDEAEAMPNDFTLLNPEAGTPFRIEGVLQVMDDCGPKMTFEHADIYSGKDLTINKPNGRILNYVVLPYRAIQSNRSFVLYERLND